VRFYNADPRACTACPSASNTPSSPRAIDPSRGALGIKGEDAMLLFVVASTP